MFSLKGFEASLLVEIVAVDIREYYRIARFAWRVDPDCKADAATALSLY